MSVKNVSISEMFGWVASSFALFSKNVRSLVSASLLTIVLAVVMMIPLMIVMGMNMVEMAKTGGMPQPGMPMAGNMTLFYTVYVLTIIIAMFVFTPVLVGWFRLCQNIAQGSAASGFDILKPYQDKQLWLRSVRYAFLALLTYVVVFSLFALAFGGVYLDFMKVIEAQQAAMLAGVTPAPPQLPVGFFLGYIAFIGIAIFLQFVYMIGFAEISLRSTGALESLKIASVGVLKNGLKLLLFMFVISIAAFFAILLVALILGLAIVALSFIHEAIGMIFAAVLYIAFLLCLYPIMFAGQYYVWKSILGDDAPAIPNVYDATLSA